MSPVCLGWVWWERAVVSVVEGALAASAGLMASGLSPAVNCSCRSDTLAVLCGCVNPSLLAELVQSKLECSEKPFRRCSVLQLRAVTLRTACCCLSPILSPNSSAAGFHWHAGESAAFECLWEMEDVVCKANGWSKAQAGTQEELLCCRFQPSPGQ